VNKTGLKLLAQQTE